MVALIFSLPKGVAVRVLLLPWTSTPSSGALHPGVRTDRRLDLRVAADMVVIIRGMEKLKETSSSETEYF